MVRWLKLLLLADLAVILGVIAFWFWWSREDPRASVGNNGLRGSVPPAGQRIPDLASVAGISPRFPSTGSLRGDKVLLVGTCLECQSGDIIGGAMRRLGSADLPDDLRVIVAGWGGKAAAWRSKWSLNDRIELHVAAPGAATEQLASELRLQPDVERSSGYGYLYDSRGVWRSSFPVQLILPDDVLHDVDAID